MTNSQKKWQKIVNDWGENCSHIEKKDKCYCLMEYTKGGKYTSSQANSDIFNFKKKTKDISNNKILKSYRNKSAKKFANNMIPIIRKVIEYCKQNNYKLNISFIPTSKSKNDPDYSDRFEEVVNQLKSLIQSPSISFHQPIEIKEARPEASSSHEYRGDDFVKKIQDNFIWKEFPDDLKPDVFILFDDIINTGAQFKACKQFLLDNTKKQSNPVQIVGLFWAKAVDNKIIS